MFVERAMRDELTGLFETLLSQLRSDAPLRDCSDMLQEAADDWDNVRDLEDE